MAAGDLAWMLPTLAARLDHDAHAGGAGLHAVDTPGLVATRRPGRKECLWLQWNIDSAWLSDIDDGLRLHPQGWQRHEPGHTQADWNRLI